MAPADSPRKTIQCQPVCPGSFVAATAAAARTMQSPTRFKFWAVCLDMVGLVPVEAAHTDREMGHLAPLSISSRKESAALGWWRRSAPRRSVTSYCRADRRARMDEHACDLLNAVQNARHPVPAVCDGVDDASRLAVAFALKSP